MSDGAGETLHYIRCSTLFRASQGDGLIAPNQRPSDWEDRFLLSECSYRLAIYVEVYRGALAEPAETLLVSAPKSALLVGRPSAGPSALILPRYRSLRCPQPEQLYYCDNLTEAWLLECPTALEPLNLKR